MASMYRRKVQSGQLGLMSMMLVSRVQEGEGFILRSCCLVLVAVSGEYDSWLGAEMTRKTMGMDGPVTSNT